MALYYLSHTRLRAASAVGSAGAVGGPATTSRLRRPPLSFTVDLLLLGVTIALLLCSLLLFLLFFSNPSSLRTVTALVVFFIKKPIWRFWVLSLVLMDGCSAAELEEEHHNDDEGTLSTTWMHAVVVAVIIAAVPLLAVGVVSWLEVGSGQSGGAAPPSKQQITYMLSQYSLWRQGHLGQLDALRRSISLAEEALNPEESIEMTARRQTQIAAMKRNLLSGQTQTPARHKISVGALKDLDLDDALSTNGERLAWEVTEARNPHEALARAIVARARIGSDAAKAAWHAARAHSTEQASDAATTAAAADNTTAGSGVARTSTTHHASDLETGAVTAPAPVQGGQGLLSVVRAAGSAGANIAVARIVQYLPLAAPSRPEKRKRSAAPFEPRKCGHCPHARVFTSKEGLQYHQKKCASYLEYARANAQLPGFGLPFRAARRGRPTIIEQFLGGRPHIITHNPRAQAVRDVPTEENSTVDNPTRSTIGSLQHTFNLDVRAAVLSGNFRDWSSLIRLPPNPVFAPRNVARSPGALPERYGLKGVLVWCPESLFTTARPHCPHCSSRLNWEGWYDPKLIADVDDSFYFWPRKLECPVCNGHGRRCTYSAADRRVLAQFDPLVADQLERCIAFLPPAEEDTSRNSFVGISRRVHEFLIRGATCESIRGIRQMITEMSSNHHHANSLSYYLYEDWDRKNPSAATLLATGALASDVANRKLLPFLEYSNDNAPHESTLRRFVCDYYTSMKMFLRKRMLMLRGDVLRGDATFKVPSKVRCVVTSQRTGTQSRYIATRTQIKSHRCVACRRVMGSKVLYGLYTVMDEYTRIEAQTPMFDDDSGSDLTRIGPMLADLAKRYAVDPFKLWYTDNCCLEVGDLLKHFPWLRGETRSSTHPPVSLDGVNVRYADTADACQAVCAELMTELRQSDCSVVGFDIEWFFVALNGKQRRTALLQIGTRSTILLLHIAKFIGPDQQQLPRNLMAILSSTEIQKCGVMIEGDRKKLLRDFSSIKDNELNAFVELGELANEVCTQRRARWNLSDLSLLSLKHDVPKPNYLRLSNWDDDLSPAQREYAARDALAGFDIYCKLKSLAAASQDSAIGVLPTVQEDGDADLNNHNANGADDTIATMGGAADVIGANADDVRGGIDVDTDVDGAAAAEMDDENENGDGALHFSEVRLSRFATYRVKPPSTINRHCLCARRGRD